MKKNSRRLKFIDTVKKFIAGLTIPFGISISFLQEVKEFASDHAGVIILGGLVLGWTAFKYIEFMSRREVDEGRYQIKGEEKYV